MSLRPPRGAAPPARHRTAGRLWRRLTRDVRGQTIVEYVLVTGVLMLIGIAFTGIVSAGLKVFVRNVLQSVRTLAP